MWVGHPDPKALFTGADVYLVPFSLMWCGFAIFWEVTAAAEGPLFFAAWGIPFVLVGLYIVFGRFIYKRRVNARTVYGLTNTRAIISRRPGAYAEVPLAGTATSFVPSRTGTRLTVIFGSARNPWNQPANVGMDFMGRTGETTYAFYDVCDVQGLERALNAVRA